MAVKRSITADPRWHKFISKYRDRTFQFATEVCGEVPTHQQEELFTAMNIPDNMVSVSSGTGTGKSSGTAMIMLNFLLCYPESRVCLTANKVQQVKIGVYKYLNVYFKRVVRRFPWIADYFTATDETFYANESKLAWCVVIKGYKVGAEESLAGEHALHMMYIVDEASGLGDPAFKSITGTLTQEDNRLLLLSQPTRNEGYFYRTQHDLKRVKGKPTAGTYEALVFNSEDSPIVKPKFLVAKYLEYGGRKSAEYMIRVRGIFCDALSGFLISRALVDEGFNASIQHEESWGYIVTCDVSGGNYRDSCVYTLGRVSGRDRTRMVEVIDSKEMDGDMGAVDFARYIIKEVVPFYSNLTIAVDAGAMGGEMIKELSRHNIPNVVPINWGAPVHSKVMRKEFFNKRAYASAMVRDALRYGNIRLFNAGVRENMRLIEQFIKLPFMYSEKGDGLQLQMVSKKDMKKKGIDSPDIFDTHAFFWLADPIPAAEGLEDPSEHDEDDDFDAYGDILSA